jgi:hypothetical protein
VSAASRLALGAGIGAGLALAFGGGVMVPVGCWIYERWLVRNDCVPVKAK